MRSVVEWLARSLAVLGAGVLCALIVLTCISVAGRGLNTFAHWAPFAESFPVLAKTLLDAGVAPVLGDFELVEAGMAFTIFAFLPICQLHGAHASVDLLAGVYPAWFNRFLLAFWETVLAAVVVLITVRLYAGLQGKLRNNETTFLLQFPVWWAFAASFAAAVVASVVAVWCAAARLLALFTGRSDPLAAEGAS